MLLFRRGYLIDSTSPAKAHLQYRTDRFNEYETSTKQSSLGYGVGGRSGIAIATQIASLSNSKIKFAYVHSMTLEVSADSGDLIWKGESNWKSNDYDILKSIPGALELLLCSTPADTTKLPEVPVLKTSHIKNYYESYLQDKWYSCPATPYRIQFPRVYSEATKSIEKYLKDPEGLPAYLDLVQYAETALPYGGLSSDSPVKESRWSKVMLGGRYVLRGTTVDTVNIIVDLHGSASGYYPHRCSIVSDKEYAEFQNKIIDWHKRVREYFDMYEH